MKYYKCIFCKKKEAAVVSVGCGLFKVHCRCGASGSSKPTEKEALELWEKVQKKLERED